MPEISEGGERYGEAPAGLEKKQEPMGPQRIPALVNPTKGKNRGVKKKDQQPGKKHGRRETTTGSAAPQTGG